ncbi:MAG: translocation/assembly module TamB domain-containing protein [Elainellaceae cyanobacterium]
MTHSPNPNQPPDRPSNHHRLRRILLRVGIGTTGVVIVGIAAGGWWAWRFIHEQLAPLIADALSNTLNRPVNVGPVEGFSLSHIRFGESTIPSTETDPGEARVEAIEVSFNILEVLLTRKIRAGVTLERPEVYLAQDVDGNWILPDFEQEEREGPVEFDSGTLRIEDGTLRLAVYRPDDSPDANLAPSEAGQPPRIVVAFSEINGAGSVSENNQFITFDVSAIPETGGSLQAEGEVNLETEQASVQVQAEQILATDVGLLLPPLPVGLRTGRLFADLDVQYSGDDPSDIPIQLNGTARTQDVNVAIQGVPQLVQDVDSRLQFRGKQVNLQQVQANYGEIPIQVGGSLHLDNGYDLTARINPITTEAVLNTLETELPIDVAGTFRADLQIQGAIDQPQVIGLVENTQPVRVDQVDLSTIRTRFTATTEAITIDELQVNPTAGGSVQGEGVVALGAEPIELAFDIQANNIPADAIALSYGAGSPAVTIGAVSADIQVSGPIDNIQATAQWRAPQGTYPGRGLLILDGDVIRAEDTVLLVADGVVTASGQLVNGQWQAEAEASGVNVGQFAPNFPSRLNGILRASGSLDNLSLAAIRAEGQAQLSQISQEIAGLQGPIETSFRWLGDRLQIERLTSPDLNVQGVIYADAAGTTIPTITNLDLTAQVQQLDLAALPNPNPETVQVRGLASFDGRITGSLETLSVSGALGLNQFAVNQFVFDPVLQGDVQFSRNQGGSLALTGAQDQIALQLDANYRPTYFLVQQGETIAQGQGSNGILQAEVRNLPLQKFNLAPAVEYGLGTVTGIANGNFNLNIADLSNPSVIGAVAVARPGLGDLQADQFTGQFRYTDGIFVLSESELALRESRFLLSAIYNPTVDPQIRGELIADQGRLEDILATLQWFEFSDISASLQPPTFASAAAVQPFAVNVSNAAVLTQIRRYVEILALRQQQAQQQEMANTLPPLSELRGAFTADVDFAFSFNTGATVDAQLQGQNWTWGEYQVDTVVADSQFNNGVLTVNPVRLASEASALTFTGQLGEDLSGLLLVENVPIDPLRDFVALPVEITGDVNSTIRLGGRLANPQIDGEATLTDATLNQTPIEGARTTFQYADARLNLDGQVVATTPENPVELTASVPYRLPFATVPPASNDLRANVNVRDEGLSLLNILSDGQVQWAGGEGEVQLQVAGTLQQNEQGEIDLNPLFAGFARFNDAAFVAEALPNPLTDVTGEVQFNTDRIQIPGLTGQFSEGLIAVQGNLPIFDPSLNRGPNRDAPLIITLENAVLELPDLYQGGASGEVLITGAALAPVIGGEINLSDTRVSIGGGYEFGGLSAVTEADASTTEAAIVPTTEGVEPPGPVQSIEFDDFRLGLGDRFEISGPAFQFVATGDLLINGSLDDLEPEGTVYLRRGIINLYSTQFRLDRDSENTVTFVPNQGLDPILDVALVASVPEFTPPTRYTSPAFGPTEIAEGLGATNEFGRVETVQVQAIATGPSSEILENLELESTPSRSDAEIVNLLAGSIANNLTLQGLGVSALQTFLNNSLGFVEVNVFNSSVIPRNRDSRVSALVAEIGFSITRDLAVAVSPVLTVDAPAQYSIRYRINDELLLRGATNLEGDSRVLLEFRTRF